MVRLRSPFEREPMRWPSIDSSFSAATNSSRSPAATANSCWTNSSAHADLLVGPRPNAIGQEEEGALAISRAERCAGERDGSVVRVTNTGGALEQRRLAGTIGADEAEEFAGAQVERGAVERGRRGQSIDEIERPKRSAALSPTSGAGYHQPMRRSVAVLAGLLLVHSAALRSGVFCEGAVADAPGHVHANEIHQSTHQSMPMGAPHSSGHDHGHGTGAHCTRMASCGMMTIGSLDARMSPATASLASVPATREFAPRSVHAVPEPPPPKA